MGDLKKWTGPIDLGRFRFGGKGQRRTPGPGQSWAGVVIQDFETGEIIKADLKVVDGEGTIVVLPKKDPYPGEEGANDDG